jgi:cytochrome c-type biogenesis protein CcmE
MVAIVALAVSLLLSVFNSNIQLFYTPTEVAQGKVPPGAEFKVGGMVAADSVERLADGITVEFVLTDHAENVPVRYTGILPDLFREGQGTVSVGKLEEDGFFVASKVLAKHDENYMPPEVAEALEKAAAGKSGASGDTKPYGSDTVILQ